MSKLKIFFLIFLSLLSSTYAYDDYSFMVNPIKHNNGTMYSGTNLTIVTLYDNYTSGTVTYQYSQNISYNNGTAVFWLYGVHQENYTTPLTYMEVQIGSVNISPRWNVSFKRFNSTTEIWNIANNDSFVPYDGAIKNINLGNNNFTVNTDTFFVDSSNDRVCMGEGNCTADFHATNITSLTYDRYNEGVAGPFWYIRHARGTVDSPAILQDGDYLMSMTMFGWNGTDWLDAAKFLVEINGTPSGKSMPTEFSIFTREENAADSTKKFSIYQDGKVRWATTNYFNCTLKTNEQGNMICGNYSADVNNLTIWAVTSNKTYIPYVGADKNIELGNNNLSVDNTTLFVDSNTHKVGINTTTPSSLLTTRGGGEYAVNLSDIFYVNDTGRSVYINSPVDNAQDQQFTIKDGDTGGFLSLSDGTGFPDSYVPIFALSSINAPGVAGGFLGKINGSDDILTANKAALILDGRLNNDTSLVNSNLMCVNNFGITKFLINADGNVGIGVPVPTVKLAVNGSIEVKGNITHAADEAHVMSINSTHYMGWNGTCWVMKSGEGTIALC